MVHGEISEAETPTVRLGAIPSSTHLPHSPIFTPGALPAATLQIYPGLGQAPNMLACIPSGLVRQTTVVVGSNHLTAQKCPQQGSLVYWPPFSTVNKVLSDRHPAMSIPRCRPTCSCLPSRTTSTRIIRYTPQMYKAIKLLNTNLFVGKILNQSCRCSLKDGNIINDHFVAVYSSRSAVCVGPIANLKGPYFQQSLPVCVCVCVSLTGTSTLQR